MQKGKILILIFYTYRILCNRNRPKRRKYRTFWNHHEESYLSIFSFPYFTLFAGNYQSKNRFSEFFTNSLVVSAFPTHTMSLIPNWFGRRSNTFDPFSLQAWGPFEGWPNRPFSGFPSEMSSFAHAKVDWRETPTAHVFKADMPGLKKEEVKVEIEEGRVLQISGQRSREQEEKTDTWHRVERSSGSFSRRFRLPENAKIDQIKAAMEDGVLTVTVPKEEAKKADVRSIEISG